MKKVITILLTLCLLFTMIGGSAAANSPSKNNLIDSRYIDENIKVTVLSDSKAEKTVKVVEGNYEYISVYDKVNDTISLTTYENGKIVSFETTDLSDVNAIQAPYSAPYSDSLIRYEVSLWDDQWDYAYFIYQETNPTRIRWSLWEEDSNKSVYENTSNESDLNGFKDSLDSMVSYQIECIAFLGASAASIAAAAITAPSGLGAIVAILATLGFATGAAVIYWNAYQARLDCSYYYARV